MILLNQVIALGHFIATAKQGHYIIILLISDLTDCLILLIYFKFKCRHKMFINKSREHLDFLFSCDHSKSRKKKYLLLHKAWSLFTSSDLNSVGGNSFILRQKLSGHTQKITLKYNSEINDTVCLKEYMNYAFTNNLAVRFHAVHFRLLYSHVEKKFMTYPK